MQLFYFLNGLAGRSELFDTALRFFYVSAVPALATALTAILIFWPREPHTPSRLRVATATALSLTACLLLQYGVEWFGRWALGADVLSPRPFVTRWVTWLVIEPNDNSLPCIEAMLAAALATAIWAARPKAAAWAWPLALVFGLARIIAGNNYPSDVVIALALGAGLTALILAVCGAPLAWLGKKAFVWRTGHQLGLGSVFFLAALTYAGVLVGTQPGNGRKISDAFWNRRRAVATDTSREGEGMTASFAARNGGLNLQRDMPKPGVTTLGGYAPAIEKHLQKAFTALVLPHRLVSIDAGELQDHKKHGQWSYRAAAVRFEVQREGAAERREVMKSAARLVRAAFHADARLQHIDVTGVTLNEPNAGSQRSVFALGAVPVFSASIERTSLDDAQSSAPPEAWLRARSLLYINARVLPETDAPRIEPELFPTPAPTAAPTPYSTATPSPIPSPAPPTATPVPTPTSLPPVPAPSPAPRPAFTPRAVPRRTPVPSPRVTRPRPARRPQRLAPARPRTTPRAQPRRSYRSRRYRTRREQRRRFRTVAPRRERPAVRRSVTSTSRPVTRPRPVRPPVVSSASSGTTPGVTRSISSQ